MMAKVAERREAREGPRLADVFSSPEQSATPVKTQDTFISNTTLSQPRLLITDATPSKESEKDNKNSPEELQRSALPAPEQLPAPELPTPEQIARVAQPAVAQPNLAKKHINTFNRSYDMKDKMFNTFDKTIGFNANFGNDEPPEGAGGWFPGMP